MGGSSQIKESLSIIEATENPLVKTEKYNLLLANILAGTDNLLRSLQAYATSVLSESANSIIQSRNLLTTLVQQINQSVHDNEVLVELIDHIIRLVQPRVVSFEQQDTDLKNALANAYESQEDYTSSAKTLQSITLDSSQRAVSDDDKAKVWMRICRCYLEEDSPVDALTYLNKVKQVIFSVTDIETRLAFQLSQARISDSQRDFLTASNSYLAISNESVLAEEERLQALEAAITCAVLAPAGPLRARQLGKLYKDDRANTAEPHVYSILENIYLDRLLSPTEVQAFASGLKEHQLAKTSDGSTVLDKAVLEHNLLAASRLYRNISLTALGLLLGVDAEKAEGYASAMIESNRLSGSIDQIAGIIFFNTREGGSDSVAMDLRAWDANVQGLAEEVEKVTTMLQREESAWYEAQIAA